MGILWKYPGNTNSAHSSIFILSLTGNSCLVMRVKCLLCENFFGKANTNEHKNPLFTKVGMFFHRTYQM